MRTRRTMPAVVTGVAAAASVLFLAADPASAEKTPATQSQLSTESAKFSYAIGLEIGLWLQQLGEQIDLDAFGAAVGHTLRGETPLLSPEAANQIKQDAFARVRQRQAEQNKAQGEQNRAEGQAFLAANKEKSGVMTTSSGLQYSVLREGDGAKPTAEDEVTVHYRGTLIDGTEFDSSYKRGEPVTFPLNGVIAGWTEGVQLMNTGSHYRFFIPSELAYGQRGSPPRIGPNATLVFEVELLEIK